MSSSDDDKPEGQIEELLHAPDLAGALETEQFRRFLDRIPFAVVVSKLLLRERIVYANPHFEKLTGQACRTFVGKEWSVFPGRREGSEDPVALGPALASGSDFVGTFRLEVEPQVVVDAYSNLIEDDDGKPLFRLAALVDVTAHSESLRDAVESLRDKDLMLRELQHRVKNNLQLITAQIRLEARSAGGSVADPFDRLAGRIEALQLLYKSLSADGNIEEIDLGVYLSQVASSAMRSHAVEGVRLDLKVDTYPVSVNVAMPAGLVVNELMTNALKHAFSGRSHGTITVHSLAEGQSCRVIVADDGNGFPEGIRWPSRGKLGALIVQALTENAKATLSVSSTPGKGTRVEVVFTRREAAAHPLAPESVARTESRSTA